MEENNTKMRPCRICGKLFQPVNARHSLCSKECNVIAKRLNSQKYEKTRVRSKPKRKHSWVAQIAKTNEEARAAGLTYGQYQSMLFVEELRRKERRTNK